MLCGKSATRSTDQGPTAPWNYGTLSATRARTPRTSAGFQNPTHQFPTVHGRGKGKARDLDRRASGGTLWGGADGPACFCLPCQQSLPATCQGTVPERGRSPVSLDNSSAACAGTVPTYTPRGHARRMHWLLGAFARGVVEPCCAPGVFSLAWGATALRLCGRLGVLGDRRRVIGPIVSAWCLCRARHKQHYAGCPIMPGWRCSNWRAEHSDRSHPA